MRPGMRTALVVAAAVQVSAALSVVAAQSAGRPPGAGAQRATPHACSLLSPAEMEKITGRANPLNLPLRRSTPDELPSHITECGYLGIDLSLNSDVPREHFEATRKQQAASGVKIQPVAGVGDDAYWWERPGTADSQIGIVFRVGRNRLAIQDMVPPDSVEAVKPILLALAKAAAPKLR